MRLAATMRVDSRKETTPHRFRPRWGLWLAVLALIGAAHQFTLPLIIKGVIAPAASPDRQGWSTHYVHNEAIPEAGDGPGIVPPGRKLTTDRGVDLKAYGLWFAPAAGRYAFNLYVRGTGELALDGNRLLALEGDSGGQAKADLEAGPHFLRISLQPIAPRDGSCTLEILGPGTAAGDLLAEGGLLGPSPAKMETWWAMAALTQNAFTMMGLAYAASLLLVLLPLALAGGWRSLAASVLIVLAPALAIPGPSGRNPFIGGPQISRLRAERPDYVVIGNSYANAMIDSDLLGRLTGGKVEKLIYNGSETTIHYLMFKNVLVASGVKPRTTFIFTSDNSLTNPHLMVFPEAFESLCPEREDPLVNKLVFGDRPFRENIRQGLEEVFGVRAYREKARELIPNLAQYLANLAGWSGGTGREEKIRKHANARFGLERLRAPVSSAAMVTPDRWDADFDYDQYLDFDKAVATSFLPPMLELARENQIRLVFVRIQRRPGPDGPPPQDSRLVRYVQRLREYLEKQGAGFHDFTGDPELTQAMYTEDDHVADTEGATRLFHKRLSWAFK